MQDKEGIAYDLETSAKLCQIVLVQHAATANLAVVSAVLIIHVVVELRGVQSTWQCHVNPGRK